MAYPYDNDYEAAAMAKAYKKPILKTDRKIMNLLCEDYNAKANA